MIGKNSKPPKGSSGGIFFATWSEREIAGKEKGQEAWLLKIRIM
jgi:hypothetical protein